MSFSRIRYDKCATDLHTHRSVDVGEYRLFPGFVENSNQCFSATGPVGSKVDVSTTKQKCSLDWGEMTNVESELQSRNIPLTDCNNNRTNNHYNKNKVFNKAVCSPMLNSEDTRFTNPVQVYRSMSILDLQLQPWLFSNPQCHVIDDRIGLDSRNKAKDSYVMPLADFVDNGEVLPKPIKAKSMCAQ
jgi:hypothetical protein